MNLKSYGFTMTSCLDFSQMDFLNYENFPTDSNATKSALNSYDPFALKSQRNSTDHSFLNGTWNISADYVQKGFEHKRRNVSNEFSFVGDDYMDIDTAAIQIQHNTSLIYAITLVKTVLVPAICIFGMVGNILTLLVLTRKRLKSACDGTERTVHMGLFALAISDLLLCTVLLPHGFFRTTPFDYKSRSNFQLLYRTYGTALINTFILTSTWLTVNMATSRYLAIVHPFKARTLVSMTGTKVCTLLVFFSCILFNIPRFFEHRIEEVHCPNGLKVYFQNDGLLKLHPKLHLSYMWVYFGIGIFLPLATLAFCNICLVRTLWASAKLRRRYRVPAAHVDSNYRITSILVTIVVMYILLVSPAEILLFLYERLLDKAIEVPHALVMAVEVTNVLQIINFSCNFVLYFILNVHFRRALKDMFCACALRFHHKGGHRFHAVSSNPKSDISKLGETSQTRV